jgi:hypothetical protein
MTGVILLKLGFLPPTTAKTRRNYLQILSHYALRPRNFLLYDITMRAEAKVNQCASPEAINVKEK